jgi:hypothetical protein
VDDGPPALESERDDGELPLPAVGRGPSIDDSCRTRGGMAKGAAGEVAFAQVESFPSNFGDGTLNIAKRSPVADVRRRGSGDRAGTGEGGVLRREGEKADHRPKSAQGAYDLILRAVLRIAL